MPAILNWKSLIKEYQYVYKPHIYFKATEIYPLMNNIE